MSQTCNSRDVPATKNLREPQQRALSLAAIVFAALSHVYQKQRARLGTAERQKAFCFQQSLKEVVCLLFGGRNDTLRPARRQTHQAAYGAASRASHELCWESISFQYPGARGHGDEGTCQLFL